MGFAIPINKIKPIIESVIETGTFEQPKIGITGVSMEDVISQGAIQNPPVTEGVYISEVTSGSPAENAGLKKGDIITKVGDTKVVSVNAIVGELVKYKKGQSVNIEFYRGTTNKNTTIKLTGTSNV